MARGADARSRTSGETLESHDPATGELVGTVAITPPEAVEEIAAEVARGQRRWGLVPLRDRLRMIGRAAEDLLRREDEVSRIVSREAGKTITEATLVEVATGALEIAWVARFGHRYLSPERIPSPQLFAKAKRHFIVYRPLGVVGIIGPWNYPFMLPAAQVAFALAAGNGVILKPSELTPLIGDEIARVFSRAGTPDDVLRVVHGDERTGAAVCTAPSVDKVVFTGSVESGRKVAAEVGKAGKAAVLELGGKDPAIVCADADLDRAVAGILWTGATNAGQTCTAVERIYVDRRVHDEFVRRLVAAARKVVPGDPRDPATQLGPINNERQYRIVMDHLEDAVGKGAVLECGGPVELPGFAGRFVGPAVLTGADHSMKVMTEETFGPLLPVMAFDGEQEAVRLANDSRYGLGASVWTRDRRRARMLAERIDAGMAWVNDHAYSHGLAQLPWGGVKSSGGGVTHSKFGFYDMVEKRLVGEDSGRLPSGWWYPYGEVKRRGFLAAAESMASPTRRGRLGAAWRRRGELGRYLRSLLH